MTEINELKSWMHMPSRTTGFDLQQLADLTKYAVQARYPGSQPTPEEAKEAISIAKTIRHFARLFLGLKK